MNTRHGASGDIGFTPKASNINGLRAIEQQYLRQNQIAVLDFEGVPAMERPFFLLKSKARKRNQMLEQFSAEFITVITYAMSAT